MDVMLVNHESGGLGVLSLWHRKRKMGRAPCCEKVGLKRGPWTPEEDLVLMAYIHKYGHDNWRALPKRAGLLRCGKSCRLRWINYLRPDIKRGNFTPDEEETIIKLHGMLGNKWSKIAARLPGRTDNEIKNVWHTHLKKRLQPKGHNATPSPKKTSSRDSSLSTAGSSLSSLNQCDETQLKEKQTDMNHIPRLGVGKVIRTDHRKTDGDEKCALPDEPDVEIPVEPDRLDLTREMLDEWSSSSGEEIFNKHMTEYADSSSKHHHESKASIGHSPSFYSTSTSTLNSFEAISSSTDQFHLMMNISPSILDGHDVGKDMNEWSDESNFADMIWESLEDDMRISQPSDLCPKSEPYDQQNSSVKGGETEVVGGKRWVIELEKELELSSASVENELELSSASGEHGEYKSYLVKGDLVLDKHKSGSSNLSSTEEIVLEFEVDPIVAYFQSLSSSPTIHL